MEIYSNSGDAGPVYEGQAVADENGAFTLERAAPLEGSFLTATATDHDGSTSEFSTSTQQSP